MKELFCFISHCQTNFNSTPTTTTLPHLSWATATKTTTFERLEFSIWKKHYFPKVFHKSSFWWSMENVFRWFDFFPEQKFLRSSWNRVLKRKNFEAITVSLFLVSFEAEIVKKDEKLRVLAHIWVLLWLYNELKLYENSLCD